MQSNNTKDFHRHVTAMVKRHFQKGFGWRPTVFAITNVKQLLIGDLEIKEASEIDAALTLYAELVQTQPVIMYAIASQAHITRITSKPTRIESLCVQTVSVLGPQYFTNFEITSEKGLRKMSGHESVQYFMNLFERPFVKSFETPLPQWVKAI